LCKELYSILVTEEKTADEDAIDHVIRSWDRERPDLDVSPLGIVSRLMRAAHSIQHRLDQIAAAHGVSHKGDLDVLTALRRSGEPYELSPSQLAEAVQLTSGGMTIRLDRLEHAGLVERFPNPGDRRGILVQITAVGEDLIDRAFAESLDVQRSLIERFDATDRKVFEELLRRLLLDLGDTPPR
jgi:DNA-binding MarR family transcriptional regulator